MKYLLGILSLLLAGLCCVAYNAYHIEYCRLQDKQNKYAELNRALKNADDNIVDIKEIYNINDSIQSIEFNNKNEIESALKLKMAVASLLLAEKNIDKAYELNNLVKSIPTQIMNPLVYSLLQDAMSKYDESKRYIDAISGAGDDHFNFNYNYMKGCIYFRYFQIRAMPQNAEEIFGETLDAFKNALKYKPKDTNTQVNIELLLKKKDEMIANSGKPKDEDLQELLNNKPGKGGGKGKY